MLNGLKQEQIKLVEIAFETKNSANLANKIGAFQKTGEM